MPCPSAGRSLIPVILTGWRAEVSGADAAGRILSWHYLCRAVRQGGLYHEGDGTADARSWRDPVADECLFAECRLDAGLGWRAIVKMRRRLRSFWTPTRRLHGSITRGFRETVTMRWHRNICQTAPAATSVCDQGRGSGRSDLWMRCGLTAIVTHVADAETCILHPASHTHRQMTTEQLIEAGISRGADALIGRH